MGKRYNIQQITKYYLTGLELPKFITIYKRQSVTDTNTEPQRELQRQSTVGPDVSRSPNLPRPPKSRFHDKCTTRLSRPSPTTHNRSSVTERSTRGGVRSGHTKVVLSSEGTSVTEFFVPTFGVSENTLSEPVMCGSEGSITHPVGVVGTKTCSSLMDSRTYDPPFLGKLQEPQKLPSMVSINK